MSVLATLYFTLCACFDVSNRPYTNVRTIAGLNGEFGEPFGVAVKDGETYVSDGDNGKIWRVEPNSPPVEFASGLETPSAIAFDKKGDLIVADTGSHTIKRIDRSGKISIIAGTDDQSGDVNGDALSAKFNAPIGVAVRDDGAIIVADTYNDKVKVIADGVVRTLAGSTRGFADGSQTNAKFDTPCSVALWQDGRIVVADTMNSRIRVVEPDGNTWTLAGNGNVDTLDGTLSAATFYRPFAIAIRPDGEIFIADRDTVRAIRNRSFPFVETISKPRRGFVDGPPSVSTFNRISGIAFDDNQNLIMADSDNAAVRILSSEPATKERKTKTIQTKRSDPSEFRTRKPARWPYEPPDAKRDIAGTLGEIRGEIIDQNSQVWFHNGLDIAGNYGEKAYFIRDEKVLNPLAAENFGTLRELIRLPTLGYIHLRLGRDAANKTFGDARFQFSQDMTTVRIRRGTQFKAGDLIGTLNAMNHVHLIAGPSGDEMNALDALILPYVSDKTPPVIEDVSIFDENWRQIETEPAAKRIKLTGKTRIVVRAFDRMDGNPERRRLGVFRLGYQVLKKDLSPAGEINWNISFDRNPDPEAVKFAYAQGSHSGATGETIFKYIVTNKVSGHSFDEGFLDPTALGNGEFVLRAFAADYFGNIVSKDIFIEVTQ
ncbi:MAG: hypothetical protein WBD27_15995 [Pyrinomonadaceae bacterium]